MVERLACVETADVNLNSVFFINWNTDSCTDWLKSLVKVVRNGTTFG